jgi:hypothetical protein
VIERLRGQAVEKGGGGSLTACSGLLDMKLGECCGGKKRSPAQRGPLTGCSNLSQYETGNKKSIWYFGERQGEMLHTRGMLTN